MTKLILITLLILSLTLMCILFKKCKKLQKLLDNNNLTSAISYNNILCDMSEFEKQNTQENKNNQEQNNLSCDKSVPSALDIAKYLIGLGQRDGNPITNLRLQKLLYYAWGTYWHQNRKELFTDDIEAWPFGPVVRDVYIEYYNELDPKCVLNIEYRAFDEIKNKLCENIKNFLERFYEVYKKEDTWDLVDATHRERPWVEAYKENAKEVIDRTTLRNFFENEAF